jgi:DNA-binding IclR family transcriptional regulator
MAATSANPSAFQSVVRATRVLSQFIVDEAELSLAELTRRLEISKPTVHRYATALRDAGMLRASRRGYTRGPRVVEMASAALAGLGVIRVAAPYLERLSAETRQTAVLSMWTARRRSWSACTTTHAGWSVSW